MTRIVDDDPPIKTGASTQAYRDNWDRIFGEPAHLECTPNETPEPSDHPDDAIEAKLTTYVWWCGVCKGHVSDPQNHAVHGVIKLDEPQVCPDCKRPNDPDDSWCVCYDPACASLCTEGATCDCEYSE